MKKNMRFNGYIVVMTIMAAAFILGGCDGSSDIIEPPEDNLYAVSGVLVNDLNVNAISDSSRIAVKLYFNDVENSDADLVAAAKTLQYGFINNSTQQAFVFGAGVQPLLAAGNYTLQITDSTIFNDSFSFTVVDTLRINSYNPDSTTVNLNGESTNIQWTSSPNVEGYIIAVTPADSAYTGYGYSAYVTTLATQATIPPDAFRLPYGTNDLLPGNYYLYVYAFTGAPDSALSQTLLPVPLPSQLSDNIDNNRLKGNFGTITVTKRVPLEVISG